MIHERVHVNGLPGRSTDCNSGNETADMFTMGMNVIRCHTTSVVKKTP